MSDPYLQMLDAFAQPDGPAGAAPAMGTVRAASPLKIDMAGITLEEGDLYVNTMLLSGYERSMSFDGASGKAKWTTSGLKAGDQVMLLPTADGQKFFVACVVKGAS